MISFIIPAHNEEALIGRTLAVLHEATRAVGVPYEIIVANDSSTDRTGDIARDNGARVVAVNRRQIAATRNAGARAAAGDPFFFVDADTFVTKLALRAALRALRSGAAGGGCCVRFDAGRLPLYAKVMERVLPPALRLLRLAPGCFLFCTREAYAKTGGFDETTFWGEEVAFARRLKRKGRFVMLREYVITSARKLRARSALDLLRVGINLAFSRPRSARRNQALQYWYGPREVPD